MITGSTPSDDVVNPTAISILVCFDSADNDFDAAIMSGLLIALAAMTAKTKGLPVFDVSELAEMAWLRSTKKMPQLISYSAVFIKASQAAAECWKRALNGADLQEKFWRKFASHELVSTPRESYLALTGFISLKLAQEIGNQ